MTTTEIALRVDGVPVGIETWSLTKLKNFANKHHGEAGTHERAFEAHATATGLALLCAKPLVGHGKWLSWVDENFVGSHDAATRYMNMAQPNYALMRNLYPPEQALEGEVVDDWDDDLPPSVEQALAPRVPLAPETAVPRRVVTTPREIRDDGPVHRLPNMLPGASPAGELHELIVQWCHQARDISAKLESGVSLEACAEDKNSLIEELTRLGSTVSTLKQKLRKI